MTHRTIARSSVPEATTAHPGAGACPLALAAVLALASSPFAAAGARATQADAAAAQVTRGKYLVTTAGCHDCHTPLKQGPRGPEPDMSRALSGHPESLKLAPPPKQSGGWGASVAATNTAWAGPWGISYTANLTPDPETGLGKWTQRNFVETIRTGRHWGRGRPVLPPMPWPMYRNFNDADFAAIYAYLRSIPPIRNKVPEPVPPAQPVAAR